MRRDARFDAVRGAGPIAKDRHRRRRPAFA
jgi:hypothetical protein